MFQKPKMSTIARTERKWGYAFIAPCIAGLVLFAFGPMLFSVYMSLCSWNIITPVRFIKFQNFLDMAADPIVPLSLKATFYYAALFVPASTIVTFLLANLLNTGVKGMPVFRTIFYIPSIVPAVASSALWMNLYAPTYGLLNNILKLFNLPNMQFIYSRSQVIPSLVAVGVWAAGGSVIIYLAGLQGISRSLYEAAEIDGAGSFRRMIHKMGVLRK